MNYVIRNGGGDTRIDVLTDAELESRLAEDYYGGTQFSKFPGNNTNYWGDAFLVIRGEVYTGGA